MMRKSAILIVIQLLLTACQGVNKDRGGAEAAFGNPAIAGAIADDMTREIRPFLAPGSVLAFSAEEPAILVEALRESLSRQGYRLEPAEGIDQPPIPLHLWSAQIEGDLLIRLSTASHRLSRVYRQSNGQEVGTKVQALSGSVLPAGPLLVEMIPSGGPHE